MKRGQIWDTLVPWIIGTIVLVFTIVIVAAYNGGLGSLGDYIRNILRFG